MFRRPPRQPMIGARCALKREQGRRGMLETTIAGSLPKPFWLAKPMTLWAPWAQQGEALAEAKRDATLLVLKEQEDAGIDTIADEHYGDRVKMAMRFAELLNEEARELEALGVDVIQFDEPAFNVYMDEVKEWGIEALHRARAGLACKTAVHICYGYGIKANIDWKQSLGSEWRQYEEIFPALAQSCIDQVSLECANSRVPLSLLALLKGKDVLLGVIDVASDKIETPQEVAATIRRAMEFVPVERIQPCTNCGMAPLDRHVANGKLQALGAGAALLRRELGRA